MAIREPEVDIDHLYQVPLGEFIAARNDLAKRAGAASAQVRGLQKPTLPAWGINQLYWQKRPVYDDLIARAGDLRATHDAALRGRKADLRGATRAHEEAVDRALKATLALLAESGSPVTDATRQAVVTTLRELPASEPAGRLARQLEPRGFDVFGAAPTGGRVKIAPPAPKPAKSGAAKPSRDDGARLAAAKAAVDAATRAANEAEQAVRRDEFEAARTGREAERAARKMDEAARRVTAARQAVEEAEGELKTAERAAAAAVKARDAAQARVDKSSEILAAARDKEEAARKKLAG